MRLDADQLEWIVREVVRRLRQTQPALAASPAANTAKAATCTIDARVVATEQLRGRLDGVTQLHVGQHAVVTPAVRDLLKERNIELIRASA